jgi:hypothetical protein
MKRKSLFFRLDELTEEQLFAEIDEYYYALANGLKNFTVDDFIAATKVFFAPVIRKALARTNVEDATIGEGNKRRMRVAETKRKAALIVAARLLKKKPLLRRVTKSQLAKHVANELKRNGGQPPSPRTIRRWLSEAPPKK